MWTGVDRPNNLYTQGSGTSFNVQPASAPTAVLHWLQSNLPSYAHTGGAGPTNPGSGTVTTDLNAKGTDAQITLVTNALNIASELTVRPHVKIVVTGGVARPQSYELTGPLVSGVLERLALDIAILGVDAINADLGASAHHEGEATINQLMASRAEQVVVVADSSKLGRRAFARICPLREVAVLVTDTAASAETVRAFEAAGVRVIQA